MSSSIDLLKAIRTGQISIVRAALDAGASAELNDGQGDPGLPLGIACFLGHADIVRELVTRGAKVNLPDNSSPTSPLSMALRGKRKEVVELLIELGTEIPAGTQTGLTDRELMLARWRAEHRAAQLSPTANKTDLPVFEEIDMPRCYGTDTAVLDAEMIRAARQMDKKS
ncbi:MAG TPA: ankyrin repeat domain-containing protein [Accumulibacter sp.]|nr:ankyrin repeat domain-containing protein [Accumulibacter sp.]HMW18880.1 ankyrin repeat domain-containing protein [Accumulibacter sp.]HMX23924.1 ankyrin repeat domain-containing protein [Accumulibacter sp.]HMY07843.1 ankyrin repeat domain-containing protein [Accumulibacter sp.]HNC19193.1 ankyrin repeat domain-containing protein [Accumulibacter sp.]